MTNFKIVFANAWFLLLLIPVLLLTLLPYFRMEKKYRRTRNRVVSVVLRCLVAVLVVSLVAGIGFNYDLPNDKNELMIVVDMSDSGKNTDEQRDDFVRTLIDQANDGIKVGVVTFGYDQVYAAPLSNDKDGVYRNYKQANLPDVTATDISSALSFAADKFAYPETAKIVLVSDGEETDGRAADVISSVVAKGIDVDARYLSCDRTEREAQICSVNFPDNQPQLNVEYGFDITVRGAASTEGLVVMYDNDQIVAERLVSFNGNNQSVVFSCIFKQNDLHRLKFVMHGNDDTLAVNNTFVTYRYIEVYDDILVVEKYDGESTQFVQTLGDKYNCTVVNAADRINMPQTAEQLCDFDEVVLYNIANADLSADFVAQLSKYVSEYGGGLFTVGGNKQNETTADGLPVPNAYNREDMFDNLGNETPLQKLLPVSATEYTPSTGIMFVIDVSGSMLDYNRLESAKTAMLTALKRLSPRDWVGVMTLDTSYGKVLKMTPVPQISDIEAAIQSLEADGGTLYTGALQSAGTALAALNTVQLKHIVLISDAKADSWDDPEGLWDHSDETTGTYEGSYGGAIRDNYEKRGITCSIVDLSNGGGQTENMQKAAELGHGYYLPASTDNVGDISDKMMIAVTAGVVPEVSRETFFVKAQVRNEVLTDVNEADLPTLDGYYGVKAKNGAQTVLTGPYNVPIYAQWNFGKGKVGSFACDLNGEMSAAFLSDENGQKILANIVNALFPTSDVSAPSISAEVTADNYRAHLSVFGNFVEGDKVRAIVDGPDGNGGTRTNIYELSSADGFSRLTFETRYAGVYAVTVEKIGVGGVVESCKLFVSFAYSAEYDCFTDRADGEKLLSALAKSGNGKVLDDGEEWTVYDDFDKALHMSYDPRWVFAICALVLFLADIAVRKFKFKWIHELIRDAKQKAGSEQK